MSITLEQLTELLKELCEHATNQWNINAKPGEKWEFESRVSVKDSQDGVPQIWLGTGLPKDREYYPSAYVEIFLNKRRLFANSVLYKKNDTGDFELDQQSKGWLVDSVLTNIFFAAMKHAWDLHETYLKQQKFM